MSNSPEGIDVRQHHMKESKSSELRVHLESRCIPNLTQRDFPCGGIVRELLHFSKRESQPAGSPPNHFMLKNDTCSVK